MKTFTFKKTRDDKEVLYVITIDDEKMRELKDKIKKDESHIVHYDYNAVVGPFDRKKPGEGLDDETITISNYKKTVNMIEDPTNPRILIPMSHFVYDMHFIPHLYFLLEGALHGEFPAFQEIMFPTFEKEYIPIRSEISDREEQYMGLKHMTGDGLIEKKLKVLEEIKELLLKVKNKEYDIPIRKYYEEAQKLFTIQQEIVDEKDRNLIK